MANLCRHRFDWLCWLLARQPAAGSEGVHKQLISRQLLYPRDPDTKSPGSEILLDRRNTSCKLGAQIGRLSRDKPASSHNTTKVRQLFNRAAVTPQRQSAQRQLSIVEFALAAKCFSVIGLPALSVAKQIWVAYSRSRWRLTPHRQLSLSNVRTESKSRSNPLKPADYGWAQHSHCAVDDATCVRHVVIFCQPCVHSIFLNVEVAMCVRSNLLCSSTVTRMVILYEPTCIAMARQTLKIGIG